MDTLPMSRIWRGHKRAWLLAVALVAAALCITASSVIAVTHDPPQARLTAVYFHTLPPGALLPSGAECAREVRASPSPEFRPMNAQSNRDTGHHVPPSFFPSGDSPQAANLAPLISGDFTGTTREILQWAACKWGIDQNVVFAQAALESWWQQAQLGDWTTNAALCPPGHGIGADGRPDECPQSYGILQNKYLFEKAAWPGIDASTAMNVDAAYAIWRSCYDGYEIWLNSGAKSRPYHAGDLWGCIGRWFTGDWYTPAADGYIDLVKEYLSEQVWLQPSFGESRV
jgi:hypothetical protein